MSLGEAPKASAGFRTSVEPEVPHVLYSNFETYPPKRADRLVTAAVTVGGVRVVFADEHGDDITREKWDLTLRDDMGLLRLEYNDTEAFRRFWPEVDRLAQETDRDIRRREQLNSQIAASEKKTSAVRSRRRVGPSPQGRVA